MNPNSLKQMAVMNVDKGEEIVGGWACAHILQVGVYKLLAKQRVEGIIKAADYDIYTPGGKDTTSAKH